MDKEKYGQSITGRDLQDGDYVFVPRSQGYNSIAEVFRCSGGGFGSKASSSGNAVFGKWVESPGNSRVERYAIKRFATEEEIEFAGFLRDEKDPFEVTRIQEFHAWLTLCDELKDKKATKQDLRGIAHRMQSYVEWVARMMHEVETGKYPRKDLRFEPEFFFHGWIRFNEEVSALKREFLEATGRANNE